VIKIAIVDDQVLLVKGISMIVSTSNDMEVIWTANNGEEALFLADQNNPDVILMDIRMPIMDGVEATKQIKSKFPDTKVIILTTFMEDDEIYLSMKFGASGYLLKDASPEQILEAIRNAMIGGTIMAPTVASKLVKQLDRSQASHSTHLEILTSREAEIALLISDGLSNREIADQLFVSEGTVKNHLTNILEKLNLRDRTQLAIYILKNK
jgi:DNA-binding NarL/FixJ family response regulator